VNERLFEANEIAQAAYRAALALPNNPALAYLGKRGIDAATIEKFGIGFAPDRWDYVAAKLREARIAAEIGERAGILAPRQTGGHYDRLRGRVTFPIRDARGRILGFGGRALAPDQEPKYLNTPESPVFRKREAFYGFPFALDPIRRGEHAVVVEGYFDLIALHRAGIEAALATCGTALSSEHAHDLRRRTQQVVLLFDGDEAGQRAIVRALEVLLPEGLRVRAAVLPAGEDPDSFLIRAGADALRQLVAGAVPALERVIERALARGCSTPWEKADAVGAVAPLLGLIPSPIERGDFARRLALGVGLEAHHVEAAVRAAQRGESAREALPLAARRSGPEERKLLELVHCLIERPQLAARMSREELLRLLPEGPAREVTLAYVEAAERGESFDLEALCEPLGDEARSLLRRLAAAGDELAEEIAARTLEDTLRWLRERSIDERMRALTRQLDEPGCDKTAILREKDRLMAERTGAKHAPLGTTH
jgi:DNA primase